MRFEPLRPDRLDASFDDLLAFMEAIPATSIATWSGTPCSGSTPISKCAGAHRPTRNRGPARWLRPSPQRPCRCPALIADPAQLKRRTIALYEGVWQAVYEEARAAELPMLREAARRGAAFSDRGSPRPTRPSPVSASRTSWNAHRRHHPGCVLPVRSSRRLRQLHRLRARSHRLLFGSAPHRPLPGARRGARAPEPIVQQPAAGRSTRRRARPCRSNAPAHARSAARRGALRPGDRRSPRRRPIGRIAPPWPARARGSGHR